MKKNLFLLLLISVLTTQCKTLPIQKIEKAMSKSQDLTFLNPNFFNRCRGLMFKKIPDDVMKNDSIIILEYYTDGLSRYSCTIYESEDKTERGYTVATSIKDRVVVIDSLRSIRLKDDILPMVLKGQLQKIVEEGKKTTLTPGGRLIITILRKEENKNKFNIQTVKSFKFIVKEN